LFKSRRGQCKVALVYILLTLVTVVLYRPVSSFDFINFDDDKYVTCNPHIQCGVTAKSIIWAFTSDHAFNWHPATWLSHMLDCQLYGLRAGGHHFTNVLFHVANTLLLFGLLRQMTGTVWRSAFVSALFAWHPLHVESVAWISERKDVLSMFFGLLTLWAYWFCVKAPNCRGYGLTLICFACGLMSKPMLVSLPMLLLLIDYWPLGRNRESETAIANGNKHFTLKVWVKLVVEKIPFFILATAAGFATLWIQVINRGQLVSNLAFETRAANALNSYAYYILKLFWPYHLAVFYPYPHHLPPAQVIGAGMLLLVLSALAFFCRRDRPYLIVGWLWFLISLLPVIGLIQVGGQSMADRYTYIPSIGLFLAVAWETPHLFGTGARARWILGIMAMLVLAACLIATSLQLRYWENSITLFTHAIEVTHDNAVAHCNLGEALLAQGKKEEAMQQLNEALLITPNDPLALGNKGEILYEQLKYTESEEYLKLALELRPYLDSAHRTFGKVLLERGEPAAAEVQFRKAIMCNPDSDANLTELGLFLARQGRFDEAIAQYQMALKLTPSPDAENALGSALESQGETDEAVAHYTAALKIKPDFAEAQCNLGGILTDQGKFDQGEKHLEAALKSKPDFAEAHYNLGNALIGQGKLDDAAKQYAEAVRFKADYADAYFNLGNVMFQRQQWSEALKNYAAVARLRPSFAEVQIRMAMVFGRMGNGHDAADHYREALRIDSQSVTALQGLSWELATDPDSKMRNGPEAVKLALAAVKMSNSPVAWDTLAAAYAETGQFNEALDAANQAVSLAMQAGNENMAARFQDHLRLYEQRQPFHESN